MDRSGSLVYVVPILDFRLMQRECWIAERGEVVPFPEDTPNYLQVLGRRFGNQDKVRRVGVDAQGATVAQLEMLRSLHPSLEVSAVDRDLLLLRAVKTPAEVECLRCAARVADVAMQEALQLARPGVKEREIAARAISFMLCEGAEGPSFEPFVMSGSNSWLPRRYATTREIVPGELVVFDMGARYEGYCSDITRTFWLGELRGRARELFALADRAQQAALQAVRPGARLADVDEAARRVIRQAGYGDFFPHLTGHGVGLDIHENPIVDQGSEGVLEPGMVLTIEPGLYVPEVGGARIEDMVLVTETGAELLTHTPRAVPTGGDNW
jgi:Xaa-Pro aminopeptidase